MKKAHIHALWIYGVIVGLAIREALAHSVAHIFPETPPAQPLHVGDQQIILESLRVVVFLITIIRFYFGAALYFDEMYGEQATLGRRNFGFDFLVGTAHFLVCFVWSYSITFHSRVSHGFSGFLLLMFVVLLYDIFWYVLSLRYDTASYIAFWSMFNFVTFLVCFVWFVVAGWMTTQEIAEATCFIPVFLMAILDLGDMASQKKVFTSWLRNLVQRH